MACVAKRHTMSKVAGDKWRVFKEVRFFIRHIFGVFVVCVRGDWA